MKQNLIIISKKAVKFVNSFEKENSSFEIRLEILVYDSEISR